MKTKKFNEQFKRAILTNRITHFEEMIDDSLKYPFHEEYKSCGIVYPKWQYEKLHHSLTDNDRFSCSAKRNTKSDLECLERHGFRSDYHISVSKYAKDEIIKISTKGIFLFPKEERLDTGYIYIKIINAEVIIKENTFWWKYTFEFIGHTIN